MPLLARARAIGGFAALSALLPLAPVFLAACATARYPAGESLLRGETPRLPTRPDSLRAELSFTAYQGGRKSTAGAALSARPLRKYKLDLFGLLPGVLGASFLWVDTGWTLVLFDRDGYAEGRGERVRLPGLMTGPIPVHGLFGFLWGDFFPGLTDSAVKAGGMLHPARDGTLRYAAGAALAGRAPGDSEAAAIDGGAVETSGAEDWMARLDPRTGLVREAWRADSILRIVYADYRMQGGRPMPHKVMIYALGRLELEIGVGKVQDNPAWKRDPFFIKVSKSFRRLETPR